ncbi:YeiH family protein [Sporomusa sp.]|uniref:YeiH family protein n=1 Tax=Sporomusa sp. TaxID=2078658 RepID=UPI002C667FB1|nr:putative sulfate exporter family transporter [Sporomusa sp.]HWR42983.1 putative sulfate exporter family transporter [Sporomusa sp.]
MATRTQFDTWYKKEDYWAIIIALGLILIGTIAFFSGTAKLLSTMAINIPGWSADFSKITGYLIGNWVGIAYLFGFFAIVFTGAGRILGHRSGNYFASFSVLFILSVIVSVLGSNKLLKDWQLETPLLALLVGMIISNTVRLPQWFQTGLRTEFYVKTGIVLMGATLPFTVIMQAGPLAILQATIVAVTTFAAIYFAATRLFGLDQRFGATLAAGGSICGVSASIAIGGACRAEKEHVSVSISMVIIWAVAMIFLLPVMAKALGLAPGPAGAWIGTSEFADAAGFAAAEAMGDERAVKTFTLMKVVGRDMFVGIWALLVAFLSVTRWENKTAEEASRVSASEIWRRFPKFIIGFFAASIFTTLVIAYLDPKLGATFTKEVIGPIKSLRGWTFTWTFLCIGLTTRLKELTSFGWKPLAAFAVGVIINVPLGYLLSNVLFVDYWLGVK